MNEKQLKGFLNGTLIFRLKDYREMEHFIDHCIKYNIDYEEDIYLMSTQDEYIYSAYNTFTKCVCFYKCHPSNLKESLIRIDFDNNSVNTINELISWIK